MNIVFIVVDTLRADRLSAYGYGRATSPHLAELAARGVRFTQCFAHSNATHPSFTTLMTGRHPLDHGVVGHLGARALDPRIPVLAEALRAHGYVTGAVDTMGRWFERGFDAYRSYVYDHRVTTTVRSGEQANALALPLLDEFSRSGRPFFLFVHYWDPHSPYLPPPPYDRLFEPAPADDPLAAAHPRWRRWREMAPAYRFWPLARYLRRWIGDAPSLEAVAARYDGEVAYTDYCIGALLAHLDQCGQRDETLVVVTGDHGESLGEHGIYYDHHGLYDQQLLVPLIVQGPGLPAGAVVEGLARHLDLAPTLLDLAGLSDAMPCAGVSLRGRIAGTAGPVTEALLACEATWQLKLALRRRDWKLIKSLQPDEYGNPPVELYDLAADPREERNLAQAQPDVVETLLAELDGLVAHELAQGGHEHSPLDDGVTLRPIFAGAQADDEASMRATVIAHLAEQGRLAQSTQEVYTPEEEALIEERLSNLGYL